MRLFGFVLLILVIIFMVGASVAAYFRKWPHNNPREQLELIANDRWGWTAQAVVFPLVFGATAVLFWLMALQLEGSSRWFGLVAALFLAVGCILWLPLSLKRITYWPQAVRLLQNYDPNHPVDVNFGGSTFWPHTMSVLLAIALMGGALGLGSVLPTLGWIVTGLAVVGLLVGTRLWHDWPPFMSYLLLLILAVGLMAG